MQKINVLFLMGAAVFMLATGCAKSNNFSGGNSVEEKKPKPKKEKKKPQPKAAEVKKEEANVATDEFPISQDLKAIDIVWIIDNSYSMDDAIANVETNFTSFVQSLSDSTNAKIAMITKDCATNENGQVAACISLSSDITSKVKLVDFEVASTNPLAILSAATCKKEDSALISMDEESLFPSANMNICNQGPAEGIENFELPLVAGALSDFFRKEAKRVFVAVSDDIAVGVENEYFADVQAYMGVEDFHFFGINGTVKPGDPNPPESANCTSEYGNAYIQLAQKYQGENFDVCDSKWDDKMVKLASGLKSIAKHIFALKSDNATKIISVEVDGEELDVKDFEIKGNKVHYKKDDLPGKTAVITYEHD